jgi:enoyl-CoA hydratase
MTTTPATETVLLEKDADGVARITLNRPDKLNAMDQAAKTRLGEIWAEVAADPMVRAALLAGAGPRAFCAGSDLKEVERTGRTVPTEILMRAIPGVGIALDKPVVAALHGYCIGFGLTLALHCDVTVAAADAILGFPEIKHGMITAVSATRLARMVPATRALDLLLVGDTIDGSEAERIGLVGRVVAGDPRPAAGDLARRIAGYPPDAVQITKRLALAAIDRERESLAPQIAAARADVEKADAFRAGAAAFARRKA